MSGKLLAVIPARGGSKGLPGKNLRPFAGLPLIAHSILFARLCPEIDQLVVSTDSAQITEAARSYGAEVPFLRPAELAKDETTLWEVVRHAVARCEELARLKFDRVLLLDPTSPAREPADLAGAIRRLSEIPAADGVIGVSRPDFNPIWHCVVEQNGWMTDLMKEGSRFDRRQEVQPVYRINGSLYLWQADFVRNQKESWRRGGRYLIYETPEIRAMSIDTLEEFEKAELLVKGGLIKFPWLEGARVA